MTCRHRLRLKVPTRAANGWVVVLLRRARSTGALILRKLRLLKAWCREVMVPEWPCITPWTPLLVTTLTHGPWAWALLPRLPRRVGSGRRVPEVTVYLAVNMDSLLAPEVTMWFPRHRRLLRLMSRPNRPSELVLTLPPETTFRTPALLLVDSRMKYRLFVPCRNSMWFVTLITLLALLLVLSPLLHPVWIVLTALAMLKRIGQGVTLVLSTTVCPVMCTRIRLGRVSGLNLPPEGLMVLLSAVLDPTPLWTAVLRPSSTLVCLMASTRGMVGALPLAPLAPLIILVTTY